MSVFPIVLDGKRCFHLSRSPLLVLVVVGAVAVVGAVVLGVAEVGTLVASFVVSGPLVFSVSLLTSLPLVVSAIIRYVNSKSRKI